MTFRQNWIIVAAFLLVLTMGLVACERPLPGGYNDPNAGTDTTAPDVLEAIPGIDSGAYPAEEMAPEQSAPQDSEAYPVEEALEQPAEESAPADEAPVVDQGESEPAPEGGEAQPAEDAAVDATAVPEEAPAEEAPAAEDLPAADEGQSEDAQDAATPGTHTVAAGENLYRIGLLYGVSWLDLAEANDIADPANLTVGQVLTIPDTDSLAEEAPAETAESEPSEEPADDAQTAAPETEEAAEGETERPETYTVQQGDNLFRIGVNLGVDWTEIAAANGIVGTAITPGQVLIIPPAAATDTADAAASDEAEAVESDEAEAAEEAPADTSLVGSETSYVVVEGDTVYSVAFQHGIPWTTLVEANDIEAPYALEIGQTLVIPAAGE